MATTDAAKTFAGAMAAVLVLCAPAIAQQKPTSLFTVANVKAAAEAVNAVEAKKLATQSAETRAFRLLMSRLTDFKSEPRIPDLPAEQVERLVSDIDVRGEGVSGTSYVATFGVTFSERAIASLLRQHGVTPMVDRGPEILIVPVFIEDGEAKTTDRNPWRNALAGLDLVHAPVPAKLAPTRGDLSAAIAKAYYANPASGVETLKSQYKTAQILLALAELDGSGDSLTLKLAGSDALGLFSVERKVKARDGIDEAALQSAARLAFETVQERWKLTRGGPAVATQAASARDSRRSAACRGPRAASGHRRVFGSQGMAGHPGTPAKSSWRAKLGLEIGEPAQRRNRLQFSWRTGPACGDGGGARSQRREWSRGADHQDPLSFGVEQDTPPENSSMNQAVFGWLEPIRF